MEIEFKWDGRAGLRILDEFIDGRIIEVQGLNGIGKSVAAQILEIITGEHTFQRRSDFESLKVALKHATVKIKGLQHRCKTVDVTLTPERWRLDRDFRIEPDTIGSFSVDGEATSAQRVASLLSARVIRGNDTITSQMREVLIRNREEIDHYLTLAEKNFQMVNELREEFLKISPEENLSTYNRARESLAEDRSSEQEIQKQVDDIQTIVSNLEPLVGLKDQIEQIREADLPTLERKISEMEHELEVNLGKQSQLAREVDSAYESVALQSAANRAQIERLLNRVNKLEQEENVLKSDLADQLRSIDLEIEGLELGEVEAYLRTAEQSNLSEIQTLEARWAGVRKYLELADAGHSLVFRLLPAMEKGFGNEIIAEGRLEALGTVELSVAQLESLIETRLARLDHEISALPEDQFRRSMDALGSQRQGILGALSAVRSLRNKTRQISVLNSHLDRLQASVDRQGAGQVRRLKELLDRLRQQELFARIDLSRMKDTFERLSEYPQLPELIKKFEEETSKLGIDEDIQSVFESQQKALVETKVKLETVKERIGQTTSIVINMDKEFGRELKMLAKNDLHSYFVPRSYYEGGEDSATYIGRTHASTRNFFDHCYETVNRLRGVRQSITIMIDQLQDKTTPSAGFEGIIKILRDVYNDYFVSIYQIPEFRHYVFKEFESVVRFDMEENNIVLKTSEGEEVSRPLSVFSSGERAFAFSLAMIAVTAKRTAANKVLVLDEFGALLDYERSDVLKRLVKQKVETESLADKVIVILPAREDLKERAYEVKAKLESQKERTPQLEAQLRRLEDFQLSLERKGYFQYVWNGAT